MYSCCSYPHQNGVTARNGSGGCWVLLSGGITCLLSYLPTAMYCGHPNSIYDRPTTLLLV